MFLLQNFFVYVCGGVSICSYRYVFVWGCACAAMGMCLNVGVHCSHGYAFVCRCAYAAMRTCLCVGTRAKVCGGRE